MRELNVVSVFLGVDGAGGNAVGVFLEAPDLEPLTRQRIAADLGFSETVFVEGAGEGRLKIHTPTVELPFAGHPLVGTAWLLHDRGRALDTLSPPAGPVRTWVSDEIAWIQARPQWAPPFELAQLSSVSDVDQHPGPESEDELLAVWAWEGEGRVRARVFPRRIGVEEDEATGSAAMLLAAALDRDLTIRQGVGSEIVARPEPDGTIAVGGRCRLIDVMPYQPSRTPVLP